MMFQLTKDYEDYTQAHMALGEFYIENKPPNVKTAEKYFRKALKICPDSALYAHYYLGKIHYGRKEFKEAIDCFQIFLAHVDQIKTDKEYFEIKNYLDYAQVSYKLLSNPVPFKPIRVEGISTKDDEYLPIISPDNEIALFTRRSKHYISRGLTEHLEEKEVFTISLRNNAGSFEHGWAMEAPFNRAENEGAATLTIDNNDLYYTVCERIKGSDYLNCDLFHSHYSRGIWGSVESLGEHINKPNTWESQPTVTSDGNTIYFVSNREGGLGGYDIYQIDKQEDGQWSEPKNMGAPINSPGHEKSPFIHTDSQTLYFSSDGHKGLGGFDIFYSRKNPDSNWLEPVNIGYPINGFEDDLGFFVSTNGQFGYYASNRLDENDKWNLYTFSLYDEAQPQKVLFIKGQVEIENNQKTISARVQLKNMSSKSIREIPVNSETGKYVAAILFKEDQILTVKKEGYVYSSRFLSLEDSTLNQPKLLDLEVKEIEVGKSYEINDIHFETNSDVLNKDAQHILLEFYHFLEENSTISVEIQGHTDNIGREEDNRILSHKRAQAVYTYLIKKGTNPQRLEANGYGETQSVATNKTPEGRAKNRRTVFVIKKK
ncbi:MAG: hypothetical protein B7C24_08755 [Bacteroidetes bacterium 4572_77]|nr:MAG: hypothetical protein B7C24_08755 [Bacteroidetes bacterium 4572_77]